MATADDLRPSASLVLTLEMDGDSFASLDALRRRYSAPERNVVPAHVTLFYRLPGARSREIKTYLKQFAALRRPIEIAAVEAKTTERGVAIFFHAPQLNALRNDLAREWRPWLADQDQAGFRPHVTIVTNVGEREAGRILREIRATFRTPKVRGTGLHLWRYRDGPWENEQLFRFGS